jgi:hypothetical protein
MTLTLTHEEMTELTGSPQHQRQAQWFALRRWKCDRRVDGSCLVLRAEMERHLLSGEKPAKQRVQPDLDALRRH